MSKIEYPDFVDVVSKYDFLCFVESKTDDLDTPCLPEFMFKMKNRHPLGKRKSGGIVLATKEKYSDYVSVIENDSKYVLWFKIDKTLTDMKTDMIFGIVYIPPENSKYCCSDPYGKIEREFLNLSKNEKVVILGDFNARTANEKDFIDISETESELFNTDVLYLLEESNIPLLRNSKDCVKNNFGNNLLNFCKGNNLFICNGRYGDSSAGYTCKDISVIDYVIVSPDMFRFTKSLDVLDFNNLLSYVHNPITFTLHFENDTCISNVSKVQQDLNPEIKVKKWDTTKCKDFENNLDHNKISELIEILDNDNIQSYTKESVNELTTKLCNIMMNTAEKNFGYI